MTEEQMTKDNVISEASDGTKEVPVATPPKKRRTLKLFVWIIFLALLGSGVFVVTEEVLTKNPFLIPKKHAYVVPTAIPEQNKTETTIENNAPSEIQEQIPQTTFESNEMVEIPVLTPMDNTNEKPIVIDEPMVIEPVEVISPVEQPEPSQVKTDYTLTQALTLRDTILKGGDCREQIEILMHAQNRTPIMEQTVISLLPHCLTGSTPSDIELFKKHRKQAILSIFKQKYSDYTSYFYALPWLLIDIHKIDPTGSEPMDNFDKLYFALRQSDVDAALASLEALPSQTAAIFNDLQQSLQKQKENIKLVNELVLSFAPKGE